MTREDIANKLADDGWCPDSYTEHLDEEDGWLVTKTMFISNDDIESYILDNPQEEFE